MISNGGRLPATAKQAHCCRPRAAAWLAGTPTVVASALRAGLASATWAVGGTVATPVVLLRAKQATRSEEVIMTIEMIL